MGFAPPSMAFRSDRRLPELTLYYAPDGFLLGLLFARLFTSGEKGMARQDSKPAYVPDGDGPASWRGTYGVHQEEPSLGELLKRLSNDMGHLVSQEVALAKAEVRESATNAAKGATSFGVALAFGFVGLIALTAFLVIALGNITGGSYAGWALGIGVLEVVVAAIAARKAMSAMRPRTLRPDETIDTLREGKAWGRREIRDLKHDLTSSDNNK
jgi:uncharacterized membrane protein YqjE